MSDLKRQLSRAVVDAAEEISHQIKDNRTCATSAAAKRYEPKLKDAGLTPSQVASLFDEEYKQRPKPCPTPSAVAIWQMEQKKDIPLIEMGGLFQHVWKPAVPSPKLVGWTKEGKPIYSDSKLVTIDKVFDKKKIEGIGTSLGVKEQSNKMSDLFSSIPGMNLSFGKLPKGQLALSMNGELAFSDKNGNYVTIQQEGSEKTRVDVGSLKFDVDFYQVPTQDIEEGDIIKLDGELLIVGKKTNGDTAFINPLTGAKTNKLQRSNVLGVYFYTKIVSMIDMLGGTGLGLKGLDPMTLMLLSGQGGLGNGTGDLSQLLVLSQLSKGGSDTSSLLPLLMMSGGNGLGGENGGIGQLLMLQALSGKSGGLFNKKKAAPKVATPKKKVSKPRKVAEK